MQYRRNRFRKGPKKEQGKGILEAVTTEGPFVEWVGMPEYYRHHLTVDGEEYHYESPDAELSMPMGETVVFRYQSKKSGLWIDRRSLGVYIDPATYMAQQDGEDTSE